MTLTEEITRDTFMTYLDLFGLNSSTISTASTEAKVMAASILTLATSIAENTVNPDTLEEYQENVLEQLINISEALGNLQK
jgi:hypothetical protein